MYEEIPIQHVEIPIQITPRGPAPVFRRNIKGLEQGGGIFTDQSQEVGHLGLEPVPTASALPPGARSGSWDI